MKTPAAITILIGLVILNICYTGYVHKQTTRQDSDIASLASDSLWANYLDKNKTDLNGHIKKRIENFISSKALAEIAEKYKPYENAAEVNLPPGRHIYGDLAAKFSLIEFTDTECPYCKKYHPKPKRLVDTSKQLLNWEIRHLPLPSHMPVAGKQAIAAECVSKIKGNKAFWLFMDEIFYRTKGNGVGAGSINNIAESIGVSKTQLEECMKSSFPVQRVKSDVAYATANNIKTTPTTIIINNETGKHVTLTGDQPVQALISAIQRINSKL